ncbi:hypothetical protein [Desulfobacula sp.]|uniref:hypothetical protein n=1 Tax=Desulfobacula sp. TaxID=2593537 RepID=UPI002610960C|nr:hypothetical protein [Desulfobacula sp.]
MLDNISISGRYIGLFLLGWFLFSYPVLTLFNLPVCLFGIPLFFLYIFTTWSVLIGLIVFCRKFSEPIHPTTSDTSENKITPSG